MDDLKALFHSVYKDDVQNIEVALNALKNSGASMADSVHILISELDMPLYQANKTILDSECWQDLRDVVNKLNADFFDTIEQLSDEQIFRKWSKNAAEATDDGILFDIIIRNTDSEDWSRLLSHIKQEYDYEYYYDGEMQNISTYPVSDPLTQFLTFVIGIYQIECHFFCEEEIELSFIPGLHSSIKDVMLLISKLSEIARLLYKPLSISLENSAIPFQEIAADGDIIADFPEL